MLGLPVRRASIVVLSFLLCLPAALLPVLADGEGFETDIFEVASDDTVGPRDPCVARNAPGEFVVTWSAADADGKGVFARRYAADATPLGEAFQVNDSVPGDQQTPSVALWDDGSFVVAWVDAPDGQPMTVRARLYDPDGNPQGPSFRVDVDEDLPDRMLGARSVALLDDGGFVVAWQANRDRAPGPVRIRFFDPDGTPRGEPATVTDNGRFPSVDARGNDVLVAWHESHRSWGRLLDDAGNPQGPAFAVGDGNTVEENPEGRIRPQGDFAFGFFEAWWDDEYQDSAAFLSHVARDGTTEQKIRLDYCGGCGSDGNLAWREVPVVDRWGRVLAAWSPNYYVQPRKVRARRFDDGFSPLAGTFQVSGPNGGDPLTGYASADADADGNVVVAWSHLVSWSSGTIEARLLCSTLDTVGPADTAACEGQRVELHAETRGRSPFTWQWRRDGQDLDDGGNVSGSRTDTLVLDPVSADDAGSYDCVVSDACPDTQTFVSPAAVLEVHGAIPEVPGLALRKEGGGSDLHFTWQNVENAVDYVVRQDPEPDGSFDTITGTADDGTTGLTVPMPEGEILYFLVHGRNPGCEGP